MTTTLLYTIPLTDANQGNISSRGAKSVEALSSLTTDFGEVAGTGSRPNTRPITGAIKGTYSQLIVKELEEIAQAPNYNEVALFTDDSDPKNDGYVTIESFNVNPANPKTTELWQYDGSLSFNGTRKSHFRAVQTGPASVDNPFSTGTTDLIALPATATKVRWYDEKGQTSEVATVQSTVTGRFLDHETYSPNEPSFKNPTLLAKIPYEDEGKIDSRVWDTEGNASQLDANGNNSWQKIFNTGHNINGVAKVENGLCRLTLDEDGESLSFKQWDSANTTYSSVSLGASDWVLFDYNFTRLSPTRTEGQIRFKDTVNNVFHSLNFQVNRASNRVLFFTPPNEGAIPTGLQTKLDPIADESPATTQSIQTVLPRSEVND